MEDKLNILIRTMKEVCMTSEEKTRIKEKIFEPSPYLKLSPYFTTFSFLSVSKFVSVAVLILFVGLGGLSYASSSALPGDFLYAVKINFKEKMEEKFVFNSQEKLALRQRRIEARFGEVEALIKADKMTPENKSIVRSEIELEKQKISSDLLEISKEDPVAAALVKIDVESSIMMREEEIEDKIETNDEIEAIENELGNFNATFR